MTEHIMTRDAIAISIRAYEHATRLGHPYLGGEHYLLALAPADAPALPGTGSSCRTAPASIKPF